MVGVQINPVPGLPSGFNVMSSLFEFCCDIVISHEL